MVATEFLKTRVSPVEKQRVRSLARQQLINESIWLKRLVLKGLQQPGGSAEDAIPVRAKSHDRRDGRLYVRLAPEDHRLLVERAQARAMESATYISVLVRSHLRRITPLPKEEVTALKRSVAELSAIGRNLNQIAQAANAGSVRGPGREDLVLMLKVAEGLRDHVKALLTVNERSWETGHAQANR
jgi:hypothetical protein